jgi:hypothetical protein
LACDNSILNYLKSRLFGRRVKPVSFEAYRGYVVLPLKLFRAIGSTAGGFTLRIIDTTLYKVVVTLLAMVFVLRHLL